MIQLEVNKQNISIGPHQESTEIGTDENTARISNRLNFGKKVSVIKFDRSFSKPSNRK